MQNTSETRCVCETHCPPTMANSNEGQYHKDKYFYTSRKILSQEITMQYGSSSILFLRSYDQCQFCLVTLVQMKGSTLFPRGDN